MNLPQVYMCSPSWTLLPPPSPFHPSGSSILHFKVIVINHLIELKLFYTFLWSHSLSFLPRWNLRSEFGLYYLHDIFYNTSTYIYMLSSFSHVWLFATLWTVACQSPLSVGFFQARILEWVVVSSSRVSSRPRDWTQVSHIAGRFFTVWANIYIHKIYVIVWIILKL